MGCHFQRLMMAAAGSDPISRYLYYLSSVKQSYWQCVPRALIFWLQMRAALRYYVQSVFIGLILQLLLEALQLRIWPNLLGALALIKCNLPNLMRTSPENDTIWQTAACSYIALLFLNIVFPSGLCLGDAGTTWAYHLTLRPNFKITKMGYLSLVLRCRYMNLRWVARGRYIRVWNVCYQSRTIVFMTHRENIYML